MPLNEFIVEDAALEWSGELGYAVGHGSHSAPVEPAAERVPKRSGDIWRQSIAEVVLVGPLREAIRRLNPAVPGEARETMKRYLRVRFERGLKS